VFFLLESGCGVLIVRGFTRFLKAAAELI